MVSKLPGWISTGALLLSFTAGCINAISILCIIKQPVSHITGSSTNLAIAIGSGNGILILHYSLIILFFFIGSIISGIIIKDSQLRLGRRYGVALLIESFFLSASWYLMKSSPNISHILISFSCGLQNAMATTYSGAIVRTTHMTGIVTDIGIEIGNALHGTPMDSKKVNIQIILVSGFIIGGIPAALIFPFLGNNTILIPITITFILSIGYFFIWIKRHRLRSYSQNILHFFSFNFSLINNFITFLLHVFKIKNKSVNLADKRYSKNINVNDVALLLQYTEKQVLDSVKNKELPCHKIHNHFFFNKHRIVEWALSRSIPLNLSKHKKMSAYHIQSMSDMLNPSSFFYDCEINEKEFIAQMINLVKLEKNIDKKIIVQLLKKREELMSTAIGNGIALPHPRIPLMLGSNKPLIVFFFPKKQLDLNSLDEKPVHTLILVISQTIKQHLSLLAHLSFLLSKESFQVALRNRMSYEEIIELIDHLESKKND